jgi:RNA polymerase sigma-70 factor, ECF subfamily
MPASDSTLNSCLEYQAASSAGDDPPVSPISRISQHIEAEVPFLRRAARRWHRESADADDLVQDTLIRALSGAHLWEPGTNLRAWLTTIMRNQFLASVTRNRASEPIEDVHIDLLATTGAEARLALRDVQRALLRLPVKQRAAVQLAGIGEKSYSEVASLMGLSVDAVRCHLARARKCFGRSRSPLLMSRLG